MNILSINNLKLILIFFVFVLYLFFAVAYIHAETNLSAKEIMEKVDKESKQTQHLHESSLLLVNTDLPKKNQSVLKNHALN